MPIPATLSSKRAVGPSTPPTSPTNAAKRPRLTYNSTNEALKALNGAKEEASLSHLIVQGGRGNIGLTFYALHAPR